MPDPAPVIYVTDFSVAHSDTADLFDIAFLIRSPVHDLRAVCFTDPGMADLSFLDALGGQDIPRCQGTEGLLAALHAASAPVNLLTVGGYAAVAAALDADRALFREKSARLFLVGGYVNDYAAPGRTGERLPYDPRLRERNPERYAANGDPRVGQERRDWATLLTSGEGVIWLPRDICLWRYFAAGALRGGGDVTDYLAYSTQREPVLLSSLPALLMAVYPDPFVWMRLFRVVTARASVNETGELNHFATGSAADPPNLYAVIAIDSEALNKRLTAVLRDASSVPDPPI